MSVTQRQRVAKDKKDTKTATSPSASKIVRRSFALPRHIVAEAAEYAPADLRENLNRLVTVALQEYAETRKRQAFEEAMAAMAADPAIRQASTDLMTAFRTAEADGLPDD